MNDTTTTSEATTNDATSPRGRPRDTDTRAAQRIALFLPVEIRSRVGSHVARLRRAHPGLAISFSNALRSLVLTGLEAAEREGAAP